MYKFSNKLYPQFDFKKTFTEKDILPYSIGALLYSPAVNSTMTNTILNKKINNDYSLALCLEDSIQDSAISIGENQTIYLFKTVWEALQIGNISIQEIPKLFIRVRNPKQLLTLFNQLKPYQQILTGFIFPKYSTYCSQEYNRNILEINAISEKKIYMMPILESHDIIELNTRYQNLAKLKEELTELTDYILNVRVGGNDFCNHFGIRRHYNETIYDTLAVSNILSDIVTTFSNDFVISGPVWEYFGGNNTNWAKGLTEELKKDKQNGFIGKTVIHPNQIPLINKALKVRQSDISDALDILTFQHNTLQVNKSPDKQRMNEIKTHTQWAKKTLILAGVYGMELDNQ